MALPGGPSFRVVASLVEGLSALAARATILVAVGLGVGFIFCLLLQVLFRYGFNSPLSWTEEIAVFCFIWSMLLVASLGVREGFHVRLSFLVDLLPRFVQVAVDLAIKVVVLLFGLYLVQGGAAMLDLVWGNTTAAVRYPIQYLYLAAPVAGALIALHSLALLLRKPS